MNRRAGLSFGVALAFAAGLTAAACGQGDMSETNTDAAPRAPEVEQTAQTTPATQPVVTVYKSPT
jgi:F0F1-type ATP synthase membrane subunit c/vacuolar-type H+-ATPase subunit K